MIPEYLISERSELEHHSRQRTQALYLGNNSILCRVLGKYLVFTDPDDITITPHLCLNGFWESWISIVVAQRLEPGMVCVDVGANHGYYTLIMADAVEDSGRVLAIEPNARLVELLTMSIETNGYNQRVRIVPKAATDKNKEHVWLTVPAKHCGDASISKQRSQSANATEVETVTIDALTEDFSRVDLVKIDVEGAEESVWDGMRRTRENNPAIIVLMEFCPSRSPNALAFAKRIEAEGFPLRLVMPDSSLRLVGAEEVVDDMETGSWSMLYLHKD